MTVVLEARVDLVGIQDLHSSITQAYDGGADLLLDGRAVERIDGAGLQLLTSLFLTAKEDGRKVAWLDASRELRDAASHLGLLEALDLA